MLSSKCILNPWSMYFNPAKVLLMGFAISFKLHWVHCDRSLHRQTIEGAVHKLRWSIFWLFLTPPLPPGWQVYSKNLWYLLSNVDILWPPYPLVVNVVCEWPLLLTFIKLECCTSDWVWNIKFRSSIDSNQYITSNLDMCCILCALAPQL